MAIIIGIDDGHSPLTAGKRSPDGSLRENHFNRAVAHLLAEALQRLGFASFFTSDMSDRDTPLATRTARARARNQGGDKVILASIHANAGGGHGVEAFYAAGDDAGERLARLVIGQIMEVTGQPGHGVPAYKPDTASAVGSLWMVREPARRGIAACLVEGPFMDSEPDLSKLKSDAFRRNFAAGIARGVYQYVHGVLPH
jgi:N-acetylmuramoyl-L-alanine amidase